MPAMSPTVLRQGPYRFFFFAGDGGEPPHIHVEGDGGEAKFWLQPLALAGAWGYDDRRVRVLQRMIEAHRETFLDAWYAFFRP